MGGGVSFLGWIDHDPGHEQAVLKALGAAKGQDARDELGLGTIRDTFADLMFPGMSTIQERVRYFLFVQWCCEIAARERSADAILTSLRRLEVELIGRLSWLGEGQGVIGILSQDELERMPSEIYWNGLSVLGMKQVRGSRQRWARLTAAKRAARTTDPFAEELGSAADHGFAPDRPDPPPAFPRIEKIDFTLDQVEARFLRQRLRSACVEPTGIGHDYSLFPTLLAYRRRTRVEFPWDHPRIESLPPKAMALIMFAAAFSRVMYGATILYNARVAQLKLAPGEGGDERIFDAHVKKLRIWRASLGRADVRLVEERLDDLPELGLISRHRIEGTSMLFVRSWCRELGRAGDLLKVKSAVDLVANREQMLKVAAGTSRIASRAARSRWRGESGGPLDYRWSVVRSCLNDLAAAPR
jgi:hypothetical protein